MPCRSATVSASRSPAEELFEGVLLKCKSEHEEKKARYIGNVFANAVFSNESPGHVNLILGIVDRMTYRQLCLTALIGRRNEVRFDVGSLASEDAVRTKVARDEQEFIHRELIELAEGFGLIGYDYGPSTLRFERSREPEPAGELTTFGKLCLELMGLRDMTVGELQELADELVAEPDAID